MAAQRWTVGTALALQSTGELVALAGGGGKTSLLFALAADLPGRIVITTTTRIFAAQMALAPAVCFASDLSALSSLLDTHRVCLVAGDVQGEKATGVAPDLPRQLLSRPDVDTVLVEADGSRMRPFKAPAEQEPVIPEGTTLLVPVAGLDALQRPLAEAAHRPERVAALLATCHSTTPLIAGDTLTPAGMAAVLTHRQGGLKGVPSDARVAVLLNKAETEERQKLAAEVARRTLAHRQIDRVVVASLHSKQPVREVYRRATAIVLAAGQATRMGRNKLLLPWEDSTILGRILATLAITSVDDIVVVAGHEAEAIAPIAGAARVRIVENRAYDQGMLRSLQEGVRAVADSCHAVLAVLADQPMLEAATIDHLLAAWRQHDVGLVAPVFAGQRGNPVLIDRRHFSELLLLPDGAAPRDLLKRYTDAVWRVPVDDPGVVHDIDRPEDYERWRPEST